MKKTHKNLLLAGICLLVLGAAVVVILLLPGKDDAVADEPQNPASDPIINEVISSVSAIEVTVGGETFTILSDGEGLSIKEVPSLPIDTGRLKTTVNYMLRVTPTDVIADHAGFDEYGLEQPALSYTITTADGLRIKLDVGADNPVSMRTYARLNDGGEVYTISSSLKAFRDGGLASLINMSPGPLLTEEQTAELDGIVIGGAARAETVEIRQLDGSTRARMLYEIFAPRRTEMDSTFLTSRLLEKLRVLTADEVIEIGVDGEAALLAKHGLDNPEYTVSYTASGEDISLALSGLDGDSFIMMREGWPVAYKIARDKVDFVTVPLEEMESQFVLYRFIDDVEGITLTDGADSVSFALSGEGDELKVTCGGQDVVTKQFRDAYKLLIGMTYAGDADPDAHDPDAHTVTVTVSYRDGRQTDELAFIQQGARFYGVLSGGEQGDAPARTVYLKDVDALFEAAFALKSP